MLRNIIRCILYTIHCALIHHIVGNIYTLCIVHHIIIHIMCIIIHCVLYIMIYMSKLCLSANTAAVNIRRPNCRQFFAIVSSSFFASLFYFSFLFYIEARMKYFLRCSVNFTPHCCVVGLVYR